MTLYLSLQELIARVHLGKQVEQWLCHKDEVDYVVIKWLVIDKTEGQFGITYLESSDEGGDDFYSVHESVIEPEDAPDDNMHLFNSVEEAVAFATKNYGASPVKFVAFGMIEEEYKKYLL